MFRLSSGQVGRSPCIELTKKRRRGPPALSLTSIVKSKKVAPLGNGVRKGNNALSQPHLLSPQLRQVRQPSMMTTALVLHLPHTCAPGGKPGLSSDVRFSTKSYCRATVVRCLDKCDAPKPNSK